VATGAETAVELSNVKMNTFRLFRCAVGPGTTSDTASISRNEYHDGKRVYHYEYHDGKGGGRHGSMPRLNPPAPLFSTADELEFSRPTISVPPRARPPSLGTAV
jgi:hypothetical protein